MQPRALSHASLSLRFSIHWTRASSRPHRVQRVALPPGMHLRAGRPDIHGALQGVIAGVRSAYSRRRHNSSDVPSGVIIGSCGPTALMDDAARAVGRVNWVDWREVGGVESIEEYACSPSSLIVAGHVLNGFCRQGVWVVKPITFPFLLVLFFPDVAGQPYVLITLGGFLGG
jgi:hypothetical protein